MFTLPHFTIGAIAYTAAGAAIFWSKWGKRELRVYMLSKLFDAFGMPPKWRIPVEFVTFIALGCFVGIGILNPTTAPQALTAGFSWTGFFGFS